MNKKLVITIIAIVAVITIGITMTLNIQQQKNNHQEEQLDPGIQEDPNATAAKLSEITTEDKTITLEKTTAYYSNDIKLSGVELKIKSIKSYAELYLLLTLNMEETKEVRPIYIENIKKNETMKYIVQSTMDYSKITSWSVKQITKDEAYAAGLILDEQ